MPASADRRLLKVHDRDRSILGNLPSTLTFRSGTQGILQQNSCQDRKLHDSTHLDIPWLVSMRIAVGLVMLEHDVAIAVGLR